MSIGWYCKRGTHSPHGFSCLACGAQPALPASRSLEERESATNDIFAMLVERDNRIAALSTRLEAAESALQQGEEERETFLAEHDENVRLHTELTTSQAKCEAAEKERDRYKASLKKFIRRAWKNRMVLGHIRSVE